LPQCSFQELVLMLVPGTVKKSGEEGRPFTATNTVRSCYSRWCQWSVH